MSTYWYLCRVAVFHEYFTPNLIWKPNEVMLLFTCSATVAHIATYYFSKYVELIVLLGFVLLPKTAV